MLYLSRKLPLQKRERCLQSAPLLRQLRFVFGSLHLQA